MEIGTRLREIRRQRKLTQKALGALIGRQQSEVYRWEKGIVRIPAQELPSMASVLGVTISDFFIPEYSSEEGCTHVESHA